MMYDCLRHSLNKHNPLIYTKYRVEIYSWYVRQGCYSFKKKVVTNVVKTFYKLWIILLNRDV